jgi:hypothetical protein
MPTTVVHKKVHLGSVVSPAPQLIPVNATAGIKRSVSNPGQLEADPRTHDGAEPRDGRAHDGAEHDAIEHGGKLRGNRQDRHDDHEERGHDVTPPPEPLPERLFPFLWSGEHLCILQWSHRGSEDGMLEAHCRHHSQQARHQ